MQEGFGKTRLSEFMFVFSSTASMQFSATAILPPRFENPGDLRHG
jgi:hypothetical protein